MVPQIAITFVNRDSRFLIHKFLKQLVNRNRKQKANQALGGNILKTYGNVGFAFELIENIRKTSVLHVNLLKTQGNHLCCIPMKNIRKHATLTWEPIENARQIYVLRGNQLKTQGKHMFCVGANGKRKENTCFTLEPMENTRKIMFCVGIV